MTIAEYLEGLYLRLQDKEYAAWYLEDARQYGKEFVQMAREDITRARLMREQDVKRESADTDDDA
jgi:hypothetical protein